MSIIRSSLPFDSCQSATNLPDTRNALNILTSATEDEVRLLVLSAVCKSRELDSN